MGTEIREWINEIWAYCEEHWTAVLASAGVALILLLSAVLIFAAKREDRRTLQQQTETGMETAGILPDEEPVEIELAESDIPECEPSETPEPAESAEFRETAQGMVNSLVKSMESAAGASGQKVASIELKIEKAQLTIRYEGAEEQTISENLFTEESRKEDAAPCEMPAAEPDAEEHEHEENTGRTKRFGYDNMNTARSGRVYTEEELLNQIRD